MRSKKEKGQIFLIVLLIMVVTLTIGLSVASRSIVSVNTTREERDSQRALAAAEAGIEQSLRTGNPILSTNFTGDPNTTYKTDIIQVSGSQFLVYGDNTIYKDQGADIWLVPHDSSNNPDYSSPWSGDLRIFWGSSSDSCSPSPAINTMAAVEVVVLSGAVASPDITRAVYDPCVARISDNNFFGASGGGIVDGKSFSHSTPPINISSGFLVRVIPLYADTQMGATGSVALPLQGIVVDATGQTSETSRKIKVFQGYPSLPSEYFVYGLFSP